MIERTSRRGMGMAMAGLGILLISLIIHLIVVHQRNGLARQAVPSAAAMDRAIKQALAPFGGTQARRVVFIGEQAETLQPVRDATYVEVVEQPKTGNVLFWGAGTSAWPAGEKSPVTMGFATYLQSGGPLQPIQPVEGAVHTAALPAPPFNARWYAADLKGYRLVLAHSFNGVWAWRDIHGQYVPVIGPTVSTGYYRIAKRKR